MKSMTVKEAAIGKIAELQKDEVAKVLAFMAGLDAGIQLAKAQPVKQEHTAFADAV